MTKPHDKQRWLQLMICFLLPVIIMASYFAYRQMAPFGKSTILTVDLGQQYVDFFAYFRHAILGHPSRIIYSFAKALGGNMTGTWAYYLMSPVNWLVLCFRPRNLPAALLIIILIKYGLAGLSFGNLISKATPTGPGMIITWSTVYVLNGWAIANQLNLMWLDGMIILPIITLGIRQLVTEHRCQTYIIGLAAILIINYYMAYMLCLFSIIDFIYQTVINYSNFKRSLTATKKWLAATGVSLGLAAWLILPTWQSICRGKGQYTVTHVKWQFEYFPLRMLAKLINGSFNFEQMPSGTPNLFIGSLAIVGYLAYVFNPQIRARNRITNLTVTGILILSMCFRPLDLLWHAGQFPVWYPYRFSFIFCFWIILTAVNGTSQLPQLSWIRQILIGGLITAGLVYIFVNRVNFPFVSIVNFIIGSLFLVISFFMILDAQGSRGLITTALLIITTVEMGLNAFNSLNHISYVPDHQYVRSTQQLSHAVHPLQPHHHELYRIGKNFYRSKDDALNAGYPGADNFASDLDTATTNFMGRLGQPDGEGFVEYADGTLLSDRILGMPYVLRKTNRRDNLLASRPDLKNDPTIGKVDGIRILKTDRPLPIAFTSSRSALRNVNANNPASYQNRLYNRMTNQKQRWFQPIKRPRVHFNNLNSTPNLTGAFLQKKNPLKPAQINLSIQSSNSGPIYMTLGSNLNHHNVKIIENGRPLIQFSPYRHTVITNLNSGRKQQKIKLTLKLRNADLWLENFRLFKFNEANFKANRPRICPIHLQAINSRLITGHSKTRHSSALVTTIPATPGWHLTVDHHPHRIRKVADYFVGAKLPPGKHAIRLSYWPPGLNLGIFITLITIFGIIIKII